MKNNTARTLRFVEMLSVRRTGYDGSGNNITSFYDVTLRLPDGSTETLELARLRSRGKNDCGIDGRDPDWGGVWAAAQDKCFAAERARTGKTKVNVA